MVAKAENGLINHRFTVKIVLGMLLGFLAGLALRYMPISEQTRWFFSDQVLHTLGQVFIRLIQLLVVPVVFTSIVCGTASLGDTAKLGRIGLKTILLYLLTTTVAVSIALLVSVLFNVGHGLSLKSMAGVHVAMPSSWKELFLSIFPKNPFEALAQGNLLQIILVAILFGVATSMTKQKGKTVLAFFDSANEVLIKLILLLMRLAPYGVFCLLANLFATVGLDAVSHLVGYFFLVLLCLAVQLIVTYGVLLSVLARANIFRFIQKIYSLLLFAFSVSSSNASIPVTLQTVKNRLQVRPSIASFVIPLGATINMDGTAIMQGVATVFIANAYQIHLGLMQYIIIIVMATLASIGAAGVPSVGLITLAMVLKQVGIPVDGIALIMGIDRLLDMARTAVNVAGDATVAYIVNYSEK